MNTRKIFMTGAATVSAVVLLGLYWLLASIIGIAINMLLDWFFGLLTFIPAGVRTFFYEDVFGWFVPLILWAAGGALIILFCRKVFKSADIKFVVHFLSVLVVGNVIYALFIQPVPGSEFGGIWLWIAQALGVILGAHAACRTITETSAPAASLR